MSDPQKLLPIPDRIYVERDETTNVINAYSCKGMGEEFVRASVATPPEDNTLREALEKLLRYFGGPVGVSMSELGRDAYVALDMQVRIGDLIDARAALSHGEDDNG